jgi:hypothetical protein
MTTTTRRHRDLAARNGGTLPDSAAFAVTARQAAAARYASGVMSAQFAEEVITVETSDRA